MSEFEITTKLALEGVTIVEDVDLIIDARFREFVNVSGDHDFELEDWDLKGIRFEGVDGSEIWIEYPEHGTGNFKQQNLKRQLVGKQLEALCVLVPMTAEQIESKLLTQYSRQRT